MTDYYIYAVHYSDDHSNIKNVRYTSKLDGPHLNADLSRDEVIKSIDLGIPFFTSYQNSNKVWVVGKPIIVETINNEKYIKTEKNNKKIDNLGNLPEY